MFWRNGYQKGFADWYIKTYICAVPKKWYVCTFLCLGKENYYIVNKNLFLNLQLKLCTNFILRMCFPKNSALVLFIVLSAINATPFLSQDCQTYDSFTFHKQNSKKWQTVSYFRWATNLWLQHKLWAFYLRNPETSVC